MTRAKFHNHGKLSCHMSCNHFRIFVPTPLPWTHPKWKFLQNENLRILFREALRTQTEMTRPEEVDFAWTEISEHTDAHQLMLASQCLMRLQTDLHQVRVHLSVLQTKRVLHVVRRFRDHFRQYQRLPLVNMTFK